MISKNIKMSKKILLVLIVLCILCSTFAIFRSYGVTVSADSEPASLWTCDKYTTIKGNVDVPNYMKNGYSGKGETEYITETELPDYRKNGILVSTKRTTDVLEFNNIIDLNQFDSDTQLIDIVPLVTDRFNTSDFRELEITLTDADDENNWFTIHLSTNDYQDQKEQTECTLFFLSSSEYSLKPDLGKVRAAIELNAFYGVNHFIDWPSTNSSGKMVYFHPDNENIVLPYSIYYNKDTYDISVMNGYGDKVTIYNLANSDLVGANNEFKGFKNNKVKLSISVDKMNGPEAKYMILNVLGTGMNGNVLTDEKEPSYIENLPLYEGELPYAVVGRKYNLFDVRFLDFIDGEVGSKIYIKEQNGDFELLEGDFIPEKECIYIIKYVGVDKHNNLKELLYYINAKEYANTQPIELKISQTNKEFSIGQMVSIPDYNITGGSGKISCDIKVIRLLDNREINVVNNSFLAELSGVYEINYLVKDYNLCTVEKSVWINVSDQGYPVIFGETRVPEKFVDGINTVLPKPNAYDFSSITGQKLNAQYEIVVSGNGRSEKLSSLVFTPSIAKFGENITITYNIHCLAYPQNILTKTYNAIIYKPEYIYEYFTYDEDLLSVSVNGMGEKSSYVKFTTLQNKCDAKFNFINPLRAEGFGVKFTVDQNEDNFSNIGIKIFDYENENQSITLTIERLTDTHSTIIYNNNSAILKGGIGSQSSIELGYSNGYIIDSIGDKLFYVGDNFFSSGRVWSEIYLNDIRDTSSIKLSKLGKQAFLVEYRKDKDNNYFIKKFTDTLSPEIELEYNPVSEVEWGSVVNIPFAKAYDSISSDMTVYYTILDYNYNVIVDKQEITRSSSFFANQYGTYILKYSVHDDAGMLCENTFYINVYDLNSPVIYYNAEKQFSIKQGDTYYITKPIVYDAVDKNPELKVFLIDSSYTYKEITNTDRVVFDKTGYYIIRFYAYDSSYNTTTLDVKIYVK